MFSPIRARAAFAFGSRSSSIISRPIYQSTTTTTTPLCARFSSSASSSNPSSTSETPVKSGAAKDSGKFPETSSGETRGISGFTEAQALGEETNATPVDHWGIKGEPLIETAEQARAILSTQAPNRLETWSKSQQKRSEAMKGPRFEQTIMQTQPLPYSAMELIHRQPVRWTHDKIVACDGGGGPLGHPKIFINTDKPQIVYCEYCGNPYANEHNREAIAAGEPSYPLE